MSGVLAFETCVCAWCNRDLGFRPGRVQGVPATNYGMCPDCLAERLVAANEHPRLFGRERAAVVPLRRHAS